MNTGTWQLDPTVSAVVVRHKHTWGLATVKVIFTTVSGRGEVQGDGAVTLDATPLDTKHPEREAHLRSADFFDACNHPEIAFAVRTADPHTGDSVQVIGQLTVRGISRPQALDARVTRTDADAATLETELVVGHRQFSMTVNPMGIMRGLSTVIAALRFVRAPS
ncbi:YceI family protein [Streptomyces sp. NPDC013978]|uniref:YceI family protein n=1 Tax=Streptomyces sp. NPDC013978 TaxID=3364869 RepID=UPI0036FE2FE9